jgi:hypothetical protein
MLFGSAMVLSLVLGLVAILQRNVARHHAEISGSRHALL